MYSWEDSDCENHMKFLAVFLASSSKKPMLKHSWTILEGVHLTHFQISALEVGLCPSFAAGAEDM